MPEPEPECPTRGSRQAIDKIVKKSKQQTRLPDDAVAELMRAYAATTDQAQRRQIRGAIYDSHLWLVDAVLGDLLGQAGYSKRDFRVAADLDVDTIRDVLNDKLLALIDRYDPEHEGKAKFSTFARPCLRNAARDCLRSAKRRLKRFARIAQGIVTTDLLNGRSAQVMHERDYVSPGQIADTEIDWAAIAWAEMEIRLVCRVKGIVANPERTRDGPRLWKILWLHHGHGKPDAQIAKAIGRSRQRVGDLRRQAEKVFRDAVFEVRWDVLREHGYL